VLSTNSWWSVLPLHAADQKQNMSFITGTGVTQPTVLSSTTQTRRRTVIAEPPGALGSGAASTSSVFGTAPVATAAFVPGQAAQQDVFVPQQGAAHDQRMHKANHHAWLKWIVGALLGAAVIYWVYELYKHEQAKGNLPAIVGGSPANYHEDSTLQRVQQDTLSGKHALVMHTLPNCPPCNYAKEEVKKAAAMLGSAVPVHTIPMANLPRDDQGGGFPRVYVYHPDQTRTQMDPAQHGAITANNVASFYRVASAGRNADAAPFAPSLPTAADCIDDGESAGVEPAVPSSHHPRHRHGARGHADDCDRKDKNFPSFPSFPSFSH
jgi:hypothetical protein